MLSCFQRPCAGSLRVREASRRFGGRKVQRAAHSSRPALTELYQDDDRDAEACAQRSNELRQIGFQSRLEHIAHADDELDVRERAKSALWQMKQGV